MVIKIDRNDKLRSKETLSPASRTEGSESVILLYYFNVTENDA
jgi:hypothetical protein